MTKLREYLSEFAGVADAWFGGTMAEKHYRFFQEFFEPERLQEANWEDFQELGDHIHAFNSMALAKKQAFGRPNYPIETYRTSFQFLAHGPGSVEERMREFLTEPGYAKKYLGPSAVSEILGQLNGDRYIFCNSRDKAAAKFLDIEPQHTPGDDAAAKFAKFNEAIRPLFDVYLDLVGKRTDLPIAIEMDQFFCWLYQHKVKAVDPDTGKNVWLLGAGEGAKLWPVFQKEGVAAIGMKPCGDLMGYDSMEAIHERLLEAAPGKKKRTNDARAAWEFSREMRPGDFVIVKKGRGLVVGFGEITGEYKFDGERSDYQNLRTVNWVRAGEWKVKGKSFTVKTLTKITTQVKKVAAIKKQLGIGEPPVVDPELETTQRYWWLNCNPTYWKVKEMPVGHRESYTTHNEAGNKRQVYSYFQAAAPGDWVLGYVTSPDTEVTTLLKVTKGLHVKDEEEWVEFEVVQQLPHPPGWETLKSLQDLEGCEPLSNNQGSLFQLEEADFDLIKTFGETGEIPDSEDDLEGYYTLDDAMDGLFMSRERLEGMLARLHAKKNIILQGPPGVGKTFVVRRLAYALMEQRAPGRVEMVQFHQSYSYEDFVQGYRPTGTGFALKEGVFYRFCEKARKDSSKRFVFVIDEVNRGNLSKIFGELLMLIEGDKRSGLYATPLTYQEPGEKPFYVPENVYIIGMMNTADRSLALVDYALRRRFSFIDIEPAFTRAEFTKFMAEDRCIDGLHQHIVAVFAELNDFIAKDTASLGRGFTIGHSYFCTGTKNDPLDADQFQQIIDTEIAPLLREYWFDQPDVAEKRIANLRYT